MKRQIAFCACATALLAAEPALAVNKNQSADFARTLNRNASTEADASFFNPAGLAFLPGNGFYLSLSNQFIFIDRTLRDKSDLLTRLHPEAYTANIDAPFYPGIHLAYRFRDKFAAFFNFLPVGGGGGGVYGDGIPMFDAMLVGAVNSQLAPLGAEVTGLQRELFLEGVAFNLGGTIGMAYKATDFLSVAVGYRLVRATQGYSGHVRGLQVTTSIPGIDDLVNQTIRNDVGDNAFEVEASGWGRTLIAGVHLRPMRELNVGMRVEQSSVIHVQNKTTIDGSSEAIRALFQNTDYGDGKRLKIAEPVLFGLGVSYLLFDKLQLEANLTYEFFRQLDAGGAEKNYQNSAFVGLSGEYRVLPSLKASVGYAFDTGFAKSQGRSETSFGSPTHYVAGGGTYTVIPSLDVTAGFTYGNSPTVEAPTSAAPGGGLQEMAETSIAVAIGLAYRLPADL